MSFKKLSYTPSIDLENFIPNKLDPFVNEYGYYNNDLIGYINFSIIYERVELNYICIKKEYRNKGFGKELMKYFIEFCNNVSNITLEVNVNNIAAIKLYESFGFEKIAIRKNYYNNDDAILMKKEMK